MQQRTTQWQSGGNTESVTTTRLEGEELKAWNARHDEAVAAAQELHPPS